MLVSGNALLPRADQLVRDNELVQEHIRKKLQKQDGHLIEFSLAHIDSFAAPRILSRASRLSCKQSIPIGGRRS